MRVFPPSTIDHPWRQSLAAFAFAVWVMLGVYVLVAGGPLAWLLRLFGPFDWTFGPVNV